MRATFSMTRPATTVLSVALGAALGPSGCGTADGVNGTKLTAQRVKADASSLFADVLGTGPITLPDGKAITFDAYELGRLSLPSGRIVAADGFIMHGATPFTRSVQPGSYPVALAVALIGSDQRIAFAQIRFSDRRVAKWEMAVTPGEDPSRLKAGEVLAYGVDSGTGCFADPGAQEILSAPDAGRLVEAATREMAKVYQHTGQWVVIDTPKGSAAWFSSGWGDGQYASYFGLDDNGEPVLLVTDFQVIDWRP